MSAIGSYVLIQRDRFQRCIDLANSVRTEVKGKWIFQTKVTLGLVEFKAEWQAALVTEKIFDYSGYVLGTYVIAQEEINGVKIESDQQAPAMTALNKIFLSATPFEQSIALSTFDEQKLRQFCQTEAQKDSDSLFEALQAAHLFFCDGLAHISDDRVVVFLIC